MIMTKEFKEYIEAVDDARKSMLLDLLELILQVYPQCVQKKSYGILMFHSPQGWVGLGYRKGGVTLYSEAMAQVAEFKTQHPKLDAGKGCIRLKPKDTLPKDDLQALISAAMKL